MTQTITHPGAETPSVPNSVSSTWLRHMSDDEIRAGIADLGPEKIASMINRAFPGGANVTPGSSMTEALEAEQAR